MRERLGTVGAAPIIVDFAGGFGRLVDLILRKDYAREVVVAPRSHRLCAELARAGTRISVYAPEATALLDVGAAALADEVVRFSDLIETLVTELAADPAVLTELARALGPHLEIAPVITEILK